MPVDSPSPVSPNPSVGAALVPSEISPADVGAEVGSASLPVSSMSSASVGPTVGRGVGSGLGAGVGTGVGAWETVGASVLFAFLDFSRSTSCARRRIAARL